MEKVKRQRTATRTAFTKALSNFTSKMAEANASNDDKLVTFQLLEDRMNELKTVHQEYNSLLLEDQEITDDMIAKEMEKDDEYKRSFLSAKRKIERLTASTPGLVTQLGNRNANVSAASIPTPATKMIKYPTMEMPKFTGNVKEWLDFWSVFQKVHGDESVGKADKFQLLRQCPVEGSRAYDLIYSYPPTAENYDKVIASLKGRFGRDDLVIEYYVRELLGLVLQNAIRGNKKASLTTIYDKVDSYIRALESMGVTTDTCAAMLYPLVESSLPEETLRVWQRNRKSRETPNAPDPENSTENQNSRQCRLKKLLEFLKEEVEGEENIGMALTGFDVVFDQDKQKKNKPRADNKESRPETPKETATASALLVTNTENKFQCIFCKSSDHESALCNNARKMSFQERENIIKGENCCFSCLRAGHNSKKCRVKLNLKCAWCGKQHTILTCFSLNQKERNKVPSGNKEKKDLAENNLAASSRIPDVCLPKLRVKLFSEKCERIVRVMIDSGSQRSYIRKSIAEELGYVPIDNLEISHFLFGGVQTESTIHDIFLIRMKNLENSYACNFKALSQNVICESVSGIKQGAWMSEIEEANIEVSDFGDCRDGIDVLIGADVAGKLLTGSKLDLSNGMTALGTNLGWTIMGKIPRKIEGRDLADMVTSLHVQEASLCDLWKLDVLGITDPIEKVNTNNRNERVRDYLLESSTVDGSGRFEVRLPFVEEHPPIPSNYDIARSRLSAIIPKLKTQGVFDEYSAVFNEWFRDGIIELVPNNAENVSSHYLPHRPVIKLNSTTKIRPVFDASAKNKEKDEPSLNDCLERGPNLIELVPSSLNRFREFEIGVVSDIKRAFLQIGINPLDRDSLRFLWFHENKLAVFRHCRVVFGLSCSPFLLSATLNLLLENARKIAERNETKLWTTETVQKLERAFYVDNCVTSVGSDSELRCFIDQSISVLESAKFELRGWEYTGDGSDHESTLVLGINWDKKADTISINPEVLKFSIPPKITKRTILSAANKIFDPIGFTCPVTITPKTILSKLWQEKVDWNTEVDQKYSKEFCNWSKNIGVLRQIRLERKIGVGEVSLHVFVDASFIAYAAVVFARVVRDGIGKVSFLGAKSRIAPKNTTTPRLELMGATIGVRLAKTIAESLTRKVENVFFWTDSSVVLAWITRSMPWGTFVYNRVKEIRELSKIENWHFIKGKMNPADLASRGCTPEELVQSRWWLGPSWLSKPESQWPHSGKIFDEEQINAELKKSTISMNNTEDSEFLVENYFSSYSKLVRFLAWMQKFIKNCKNKNRQKNNSIKEAYLTCGEIKNAEVTLIKYLQERMFGNNKDKQITSLRTFLNTDGIRVLKTKIFYRKDDLTFLCPIILGKGKIIELLIRETHEQNGHVGNQMLKNILREKYWILSLRNLIRKIVSKCVVCQKHKVQSLKSETPPLPLNRVRDARVFEIIGIDFAGPLILKDGSKAWICLFTCAIFRAVHLELASALSTNAFISCLRRFIARRGRPSKIYSDNGTNFCGTSNALDTLDWSKIQHFSSVRRIEWYFNPPSAPWWGGWWERLIGIVKVILRKILGKASLDYEEINTILCDTEAIINSRPLTYATDGSEDLKPLSPSLFLQEIPEIGLPDCDILCREKLTKKLRYRQTILEDLRKRFRIEYLGQLFLKFGDTETQTVIRQGDVVLIGDPKSKRIDWPLARVVDVIKGRDGKVRVCILKTENGLLRRAIQSVYPLEIPSNPDGETRDLRQRAEIVLKNVPKKNVPKNKKNCIDKENCNNDDEKPCESPIPDSNVTTRSGRISKKPERFQA